MKHFVVLLTLAVTLTLCVAVSSKAAPPRNVIVIVADDQGAADAGCYGAKDLATPNIDALAVRGIRFTQFYSAAPVCSLSLPTTGAATKDQQGNEK